MEKWNMTVGHDPEVEISLVIPSLNQGRFISQTIDSILDQDYKSVEVIVVDGGSKDGTVEILKSYDQKIRWMSEKDKGQTDAINKGMRIATGKILGYINSDDYLLPGTLKIISESFRDKEAAWISGDAIIVNEDSKEIQKGVRWYKTLLRKISSKPLLLITDYLVQPSTFWKRDLMNKVGYFDESLHYTMDYDYWLRLIRVSSPHLLNEAISAFRIHSESKGGRKYREQINEEFSVIKNYTNNRILLFFHRIHSWIIILFYHFLKDLQFNK